jgi:hypothetical protein
VQCTYEPLKRSQAKARQGKVKQGKPHQTKELTEVGEFREAQVDVCGSALPFLRLIASLGSVKNTFILHGN